MASENSSLLVPMRMIFLMWLVFAFEQFTFQDLGFLGIYPRDLFGLIGIATAPLIHGNLQHLISNTIPFMVLAGALFFFYPDFSRRIFYGIYFSTGLLVWIFGRKVLHIGASGVVYGLASFLFFYGIFKKDIKSLAIAIVVFLLYGGMAFGALPIHYQISWESHLMGAIAGFLFAMQYGKQKSRSRSL